MQSATISESTMESTSTADIDTKIDVESSSTIFPDDLLHRIATVDAFQTETHSKIKRCKTCSNMVRVVPIRGRSEDREKPLLSITQRSSSVGYDGPKPIPPPYTSARTPEAGILLTLGERIRTFINPRRENRPPTSRISTRNRAHSTGNKLAFSKLFHQESEIGDEFAIARKTRNDILLAARRLSESGNEESQNPQSESSIEGTYGTIGPYNINGVRLPPLSAIKSDSITVLPR